MHNLRIVTVGTAAIGICALTVLTSHGRLDAQEEAPVFLLPVPSYATPEPLPDIQSVRDPFQRLVVANETRSERTWSIDDREPAPALPVLPPNAGAAGTAVPPEAGGAKMWAPEPAAALLGVALGRRPLALISLKGSINIYAVGDRLGTTTIRSISEDGVTLADAATLRMVSP